MTEFTEAAKGLTDLPIAFLALIFAVISFKKGNKKWCVVFLFTGISAIFGVVAHTFVFSDLTLKIIWTVLYILLFESVRRFTVLLLKLIHKSDSSEKYIKIAEFSLCFVCLFFLYGIGKNDILVLVLFALICLILLISGIIKHKYKNKYIYLLFCLLTVTALLQIPAKAFPLLVVFEHLFLFASLFVVYIISKNE